MIKERVKKLFLQLPWVKEQAIEAFRLAHKDVLEGLEYDVEERAKELTAQTLESLLSLPEMNSVVSIKNNTLYIGNKAVDEGMISTLKSEAQFLENSELWKLLYNSPKALAEKAMFKDDGKLDTLLLKGRTILYMLETQLRIVTIFSQK